MYLFYHPLLLNNLKYTQSYYFRSSQPIAASQYRWKCGTLSFSTEPSVEQPIKGDGDAWAELRLSRILSNTFSLHYAAAVVRVKWALQLVLVRIE